MNNLTKAQVLALFIGAASAADLAALQVINGPYTVYNALSAEAKKQTATRHRSSGVPCTDNTKCTGLPDEFCAAIQLAGAKAEEVKNICVYKDNCTNLGKLNSKAFSVQCWKTPDSGSPVAPALVDPAALLLAVQGWITKKTVSWEVKNLYVSKLFNFQDGWWTESAGTWTEVDKVPNNSCFGNDGCPPLADGVDKGKVRCCAKWPDSNNKQCKVKALAGTNVTVGPATFVPTCSVDAGGNVEHSKDDIAATALSDASEKITKFQKQKADEEKKAAGYDKMTAEEQKKYNEEVAAKKLKKTAFFTELKKEAGVDKADCKDDCKLRYEKDLYDWIENSYKLCKADPKQIACVKKDDLRKEEMKQRGAATKNFFAAMDDSERAAFKKGRKDAVAKQESSLTAAWLEEKKPKAGEAGSSCKDAKCTGKDMCCGTSTPSTNASGVTTGQKEKVCAIAKDGWSNVLGKKFTHVCASSGAAKLMASAAAAVAAISLM